MAKHFRYRRCLFLFFFVLLFLFHLLFVVKWVDFGERPFRIH